MRHSERAALQAEAADRRAEQAHKAEVQAIKNVDRMLSIGLITYEERVKLIEEIVPGFLDVQHRQVSTYEREPHNLREFHTESDGTFSSN